MKVIIAGSRKFTDYKMLRRCIAQIINKEGIEITEVVSGTARGADQLGERWAQENGIPVKRFPADWDKYGIAAGHIRNAAMSEYGDFLIAFWHPTSRGTTNMVANMIHRKKPYRRFDFEMES